jgi:hypothetical protein
MLRLSSVAGLVVLIALNTLLGVLGFSVFCLHDDKSISHIEVGFHTRECAVMENAPCVDIVLKSCQPDSLSIRDSNRLPLPSLLNGYRRFALPLVRNQTLPDIFFDYVGSLDVEPASQLISRLIVLRL